MKYEVVYILGPSGMLGSTAMQSFARMSFEVNAVAERFCAADPWVLTDTLNRLPAGIVVNAIGAIPQRRPSESQLLEANALLPMHLAAHLAPDHLLVHPSTDCVFAGSGGAPYGPKDPADARDLYGWTKALGERAAMSRPNTIVVRVSVIGGTATHGSGLLGWLLGHPDGSRVPGYTNHLWNGITSLEWCRLVAEMIGPWRYGRTCLVQASSGDGLTKFDLLSLAAAAYRRDLCVVPTAAGVAVDRRLRADLVRPAIQIQLEELADFERSQRAAGE